MGESDKLSHSIAKTPLSGNFLVKDEV